MYDWISKVHVEHFGYGIQIAGKVLPVPFTSILIGFIEWSLPRFHRSYWLQEALANKSLEMGPTGQSNSIFPFIYSLQCEDLLND